MKSEIIVPMNVGVPSDGFLLNFDGALWLTLTGTHDMRDREKRISRCVFSDFCKIIPIYWC